MLFSSLIAPILFLSTFVLGDVSISKPIAGASYAASGGTVKIPLEWIESNSRPPLTEINSYTFVICTGPNSNIKGTKIKEVAASDMNGFTTDLQVPSTVGQDGSYFIQVYSTVKGGGYTIHYSPRFQLQGMTGTNVASGGNAEPPNAEVNLNTEETTTVDPLKSFSVYYTSQTGRTRYAPMQTQPGSKVTATTWSRKFPTSAVTYYSSLKTSLNQVSTVTPGWSYTISSLPNFATPAPFPSENGGWYNPSSRIKKPTLTKLTADVGSSST